MKRIVSTLFASLCLAIPAAFAGPVFPDGLGTTVVISSEQLAKYSSADIRNALAGLCPWMNVTENYGGPGVSALEHTGQYGSSAKVSVSSRGNSMVFLLDGVPVLIGETPLDPEQIESITIVRDILGKTAFGAVSAGGVVYIRTKRGTSEKGHYMNFGAEAGVNMVDRLPGYADAGEYALANNLARYNSGLQPLYTKEDVACYAKNDPMSVTHPGVDYRSLLMKNAYSYRKANLSSGGATDNTKYFVSLGYLGEDDIFRIGPVSDYNRIGINAGIDVALHRYITASFGFLSSYTVRRSGGYDYSATNAQEFPAMISDIVATPPLAFPIYADNSPELESPWYAVSSKYKQNPYANLVENGRYTETTRKGLLTTDLEIDLGFLVRGLRSRTSGAFDVTNLVRIGKNEDYAAYILTPVEDFLGEITMVPEKSASHSVVSVSDNKKLLDYYSNRFYLKQALTFDRTFGANDISASADFLITKRSQKFITEHRRWVDFDFGARDVIAGKFTLQAALNVHGTYSLLDVWSASPSFGAGWKVSDRLKLRAQGGLIHYDPLANAGRDVDNFTWGSGGIVFGPYSSGQWFGSSKSAAEYRTYATTLANPSLRLEKRYEISAGADMKAASDRMGISLTFYDSLIDGPASALANVIPSLAGISSATLYMNYAENRRYGTEFLLGWNDTRGDFSYSVSAWGSTDLSEILRIDEIRYPEAYRSKVGHSLSSIWGLKCVGQYASDAEAAAASQSFDDSLRKGDLKYVDMNGDGTIDDNDICCIGDSSPKLRYGLDIDLRWKDFDLTLVANGQAFCDVMLSGSYFWNGWGDDNYSNFTLRHISDPSYPSITYNKTGNNFRNSTFWLSDGGWFKVQTLEIGYRLPVPERAAGIKGMRLYVRANNLLTVSPMKDVDPESMTAGISNYPLMRTVVGGLKLSF